MPPIIYQVYTLINMYAGARAETGQATTGKPLQLDNTGITQRTL